MIPVVKLLYFCCSAATLCAELTLSLSWISFGIFVSHFVLLPEEKINFPYKIRIVSLHVKFTF